MKSCYRRQRVAHWAFAFLAGGVVAACKPAPHAAKAAGADSGEPTIALLTYLGGSKGDALRDVAVDDAGNIFVAGGTTSADFPVTAGAFGRTFKSHGREQDAFVAKLSREGRIIWATFLSSPNYDRVYGIEVDKQGYVYVAGRAGDGFPVTPGAFQTRFYGSTKHEAYGEQDGFVCKLKPDGSTVVFCSYFGDSDIPPIRDLALDSKGDIYVVSSTGIGELPKEWFANAYQKTVRGERDLVIAKIKNDGSRVLWATYLGGSRMEFNTTSIRVDAAGNSYVITTTTSPDAPVPNGFDTKLGGPSDTYVAKLSADGSQLLWGTYFGGSGRDGTETHEIAIDDQKQVYIGAMTNSADLPITQGAAQPRYGGTPTTAETGVGGNLSGDAFVAKISADGRKLLASTYVGGSAGDGIEGVSVDSKGNVFVTGGTYSNDMHLHVNLRQGRGGKADFFALKLTSDFKHSVYAQIGGEGMESVRSSTVDRAGDLYLVGETGSASLPTKASMQSTRRGESDAVFARIKFR